MTHLGWPINEDDDQQEAWIGREETCTAYGICRLNWDIKGPPIAECVGTGSHRKVLAKNFRLIVYRYIAEAGR